jgi:hypothetical protein
VLGCGFGMPLGAGGLSRFLEGFLSLVGEPFYIHQRQI